MRIASVVKVREDRPVKRRYTGPGVPHCYCPDPGAYPDISKSLREKGESRSAPSRLTVTDAIEAFSMLRQSVPITPEDRPSIASMAGLACREACFVDAVILTPGTP